MNFVSLQYTGEENGSSDDEGMLCEFQVSFFSMNLLFNLCFHFTQGSLLNRPIKLLFFGDIMSLLIATLIC